MYIRTFSRISLSFYVENYTFLSGNKTGDGELIQCPRKRKPRSHPFLSLLCESALNFYVIVFQARPCQNWTTPISISSSPPSISSRPRPEGEWAPNNKGETKLIKCHQKSLLKLPFFQQKIFSPIQNERGEESRDLSTSGQGFGCDSEVFQGQGIDKPKEEEDTGLGGSRIQCPSQAKAQDQPCFAPKVPRKPLQNRGKHPFDRTCPTFQQPFLRPWVTF